MRIKFLLGIILTTALILGACSQPVDNALVEQQLGQILTQSALKPATETAQPPRFLPATWTPTPSLTAKPVSFGGAVAIITITSIQELGPGRAIVYWDAIGDAPAGFNLVWTTEERKPVYLTDNSSYTGDPNARSSMLSGFPGFVYVLRVCRSTPDGCDNYSEAGFFTFTRFPPTPTINLTRTAMAITAAASSASSGGGGGGGGGGSSSTAAPKFAITSIVGGTTLKAKMTWTSDASPSDGFNIYYSTTNQEPKQGSDSYFVIEDGTARLAYVDGLAGTTYYYRMCKVAGGACTEYTAAYKFTFLGTAVGTATPQPPAPNETAELLISTITDTTIGKATIVWAAKGKFPEGFRILYSDTNQKPTLKDTVVKITDIALRSAEVSGTPNTRYYFRVCKFVSGVCVVYSPVVSFKFAEPPEDSSFILSLDATVTDPGKVGLTWSAVSPAPAGFLVLWAAAPTEPKYPSQVKDDITDGTATTYTASGLTSGKGYNFRLCLFDGDICTAYSTMIAATAP